MKGMSCTLLENVQFYTKLIVMGQAASAASSYLGRLLLKVPLYLKFCIENEGLIRTLKNIKMAKI